MKANELQVCRIGFIPARSERLYRGHVKNCSLVDHIWPTHNSLWLSRFYFSSNAIPFRRRQSGYEWKLPSRDNKSIILPEAKLCLRWLTPSDWFRIAGYEPLIEFVPDRGDSKDLP